MTKTSTPASHAVNTAPISADLRGMDPIAAAAHTCIRPQCDPAKCSDCACAVAPADEAGQMVLGLLNTLAVDDLGNPFEQGDSPAVDLARKWLQNRNAADLAAQHSRECLQQSESSCRAEAKNLRHGDVITCVDAKNAMGITEGTEYTVKCGSGARSGKGVIVTCDDGEDAEFLASRFTLKSDAALQAAPPAPAGVAVPDGFALVPKRLTPAMERVLCADEEGWQWEDLLAAAEAITEQEYAALAAAPALAVEVPEGVSVDAWRKGARFALEAVSKVDSICWLTDSMKEICIKQAAEAVIVERDRMAAAPAQEHATQLAGQGQTLEQDVRNALAMLEEGEWAEHFAKTELGRRLEAAITELHSELNELHSGLDDAAAPALEAPAAPVLYVSPEQLAKHTDPDGLDSAEAGRYLPSRKTPAGKFTQALYAQPLAAVPQAPAAPVGTEMLAALQAVAMDVVGVGGGENTISDAARAKVEAVLEKIGAPWPRPVAAAAQEGA